MTETVVKKRSFFNLKKKKRERAEEAGGNGLAMHGVNGSRLLIKVTIIIFFFTVRLKR